ncbi:MAG: hypothetical protein OEO23_03095, partial [Gemmatimonadota bacterium]|nr:hypothetical protein [Gemmatimonadota bacterium]
MLPRRVGRPSRVRKAVWFAGCALLPNCGAEPPLEPVLVATASQMGPVGYRDPAGGISPDGRLVAYT